jgi:hypothetical protein
MTMVQVTKQHWNTPSKYSTIKKLNLHKQEFWIAGECIYILSEQKKDKRNYDVITTHH